MVQQVSQTCVSWNMDEKTEYPQGHCMTNTLVTCAELACLMLCTSTNLPNTVLLTCQVNH